MTGLEQPDDVVESEGETVGEAKWTALRELERRFPGLEKANVRFTVLSEGAGATTTRRFGSVPSLEVTTSSRSARWTCTILRSTAVMGSSETGRCV